MTNIQNRQVRLAARLVGLPKRADWEFTTECESAPTWDPGLIGNRRLKKL